MSKLKSGNLGWGERLAIINKFGLNDSQATTAFGVSADELTTARSMVNDGVFIIPTDMDFGPYENELKGFKKPSTGKETSTKPVTATKPKREVKKRGRKGTKILDAFRAVPTTAVPAEEFATTHSVSMAVLRQARRFDTTGLPGAVKVKKDRQAGILMIWRETA